MKPVIAKMGENRALLDSISFLILFVDHIENFAIFSVSMISFLRVVCVYVFITQAPAGS